MGAEPVDSALAAQGAVAAVPLAADVDVFHRSVIPITAQRARTKWRFTDCRPFKSAR